jgi:hypothetical protein
VLRLTGQATVHPGLPPLPVLAHLARRYYLAPAAVRCEVQHLRLWRLRMAYYAQADAVWIEVRPTAAELLSVPG